MSLHLHKLEGCRPSPLARYLKALAVLRLIGEQVDPGARGFWKDDVFHLITKLSRDEVQSFFLDRYAPTPMIGPWNGGSGFYEGDAIEGREALRRSVAPRFAAYRDAIEAVLGWPELPATGLAIGTLCQRVRSVAEDKKGKARDELLNLVGDVEAVLSGADAFERSLLLASTVAGVDARTKDGRLARPELERARKLARAAKKVRSKFKAAERSAGKEMVALAVRRRLPAEAVRWLDASLVVTADGELKFPPLLGSGGNEGRLDYTNAFTAALQLAVVERAPDSEHWLRAALWATPCAALCGPKTGQFDPGRAGGFNQCVGLSGEPGTNPWDSVFNLEGAIVWASSSSRIGGAEGPSGLSSPFTVRLKAVGYASADSSDEGAARAEIWAPLWQRAVNHAELAAFIAESRAQVGRRSTGRGVERRPVRTTTEFAEAASSLGVARGVTSFERFGLLKRRGDSYVALPTGRFAVHERSEADLIRDLDPLLAELDTFLRSFGEIGPPESLSSLRRGIDRAIFDALQRPSALALQVVLATLGLLERSLALRDRSKKPKLHRPLGGLHPRWLRAADDGSLEFRIAACLASIGAPGKVGPLRANITSIDPAVPWAWAKGRGQVAWSGATFPRRLVGVLRQRMMDAARLGEKRNPLFARLTLAPGDIASFLAAETDDVRIEELVFGLSLVDFRRDAGGTVGRALQPAWSGALRPSAVPSQFALLKLLFWPEPVRVSVATQGVSVSPEPSVLPLLLAGRVDEACRVARRRLYASQLCPVNVTWPSRTGLDSVRLAAALLLPCHSGLGLARAVLNEPSPS